MRFLLLHVLCLYIIIISIDSSTRLTDAEQEASPPFRRIHAEQTLGKIIAYAVFLSYYICSGNGAYPTRGLWGSMITWFLLLILGYNYSGDVLYWGKFMWYGVLWLYAFYMYSPETQYMPFIMVLLVLLLVNTPGPWMIDWEAIGTPNILGKLLFERLYAL